MKLLRIEYEMANLQVTKKVIDLPLYTCISVTYHLVFYFMYIADSTVEIIKANAYVYVII